MKNHFFSLLPIGGVDEIGSNMTIVRGKDEDVIIDCGLLFPYEECFDIHYLIPDFSLVDPVKTRHIVITHGHEDHIGALGHLLKKFPDLTVWVTPFSLHLIQKKLEDYKLNLKFQLYKPGEDILFSNFEITPVHVNHSIPQTNGLIIRSLDKQWGALYISDFKVDLTSTHEPAIDLSLIKDKLSVCTHSAYFIDSTNILFDGKTNSENGLEEDLQMLINRPERRIFLTQFASNVHRINAIASYAKSAGRKIVIMGRSLWTYLEAARESGETSIGTNELYLPDQVKGEEGKMLIFLSGCQGDFLSALRRFSFGEDGNFRPSSGDVVIFSSKVIPGNEKKIFRIYNKLTQFGAEIITAHDHLIHASGHPGKEDLKLLLNHFQPDFYFPIHGESYMLSKHHQFIAQNYPSIRSQVIHNYHEVILREGSFSLDVHEEKAPRLIHGKNLEIEKTQISQRRKMATQGTVFITYLRNSHELAITTLGLPLMAQDHLENLKGKLQKQIDSDLKNREIGYFKDQLKISARQFFNHLLGYRPLTEVHLF